MTNRNPINLVNISVFVLTLIFVANIPEYILAKRIGIFPYHFSIVACIIFLSLATLSGSLTKIPYPNYIMICWFVLLTVICTLSLLLSRNDPVALQSFNKISMFVGIAITFTLISKSDKVFKACGLGIAAGVLLSSMASYIEFFNPDIKFLVDVMFESRAKEGVTQRVGGLHGNPNANGYALALGLFVGQFFLPKSLRFIFTMIVGFAVFSTVSRSALILWTMVVFISFWLGLYSKGGVLSKLLAISLILSLSTLLVTGQIPYIIESLGLSEYMNTGMLDRLSSGFLSQGDSSTESRLGVASHLFNKFTENPILGYGLGTSNSSVSDAGISSHNMALRMASELGILGLLVYFGLAAVPVIVKSVEGFVFITLFFFVNMFSNTTLDKPLYAILIPVAIVYFSKAMKSKRHGKVRRKRRTVKREYGYI